MGAISETQLNDFLKNVERYKKESQLAKEFGDEMISGIIKLGWETWKNKYVKIILWREYDFLLWLE